ncbi:MAG: hypothetical protein ACWGSQ_00410 [Longimicrobiales bacterium]
MIWSPMRRTNLAFSLVLALTAAGSVGGAGGAQELPWIEKGRIRLDFAPSFWAWDSRFGHRMEGSDIIEEVESLGMDLTADPLGKEVLPYLDPLEKALGEALQQYGYRVRLGASQAIMEQSRLVFPFRLDLGVTDWLTVGAMVPLVRTRTEGSFVLDADSLLADVGPVPSAGSFLSTFRAVLDNAEASHPGDPNVIQARAYLDALNAAYDHDSVFPVAGSATGAQLQARLDEIRLALESGGITGIPETVPLAEDFLDEEGFSSLLTSPAMGALPLANWTRPFSIGDVEITAAARVLHRGFEPDSLGELPFFRIQLGVGGLVRLGTGSQGDPNRFFDLDPADGQMDFEGSIFGLLELGSRLGGWAHLRYGIQQEGEVLRRIADPTEILPPLDRLALLNRTPGNYVDFQVNPRFYFTPEMTFGVRYRFWSKGEDHHTLPPTDPEAPVPGSYRAPQYLNYETRETLQEVGFSATYSSLAANARGDALFPLVVRFTYMIPFRGAGGQTPKGNRFEAGVSVYRRLWGSGKEAQAEPDPPGRR